MDYLWAEIILQSYLKLRQGGLAFYSLYIKRLLEAEYPKGKSITLIKATPFS